VAYEPQIYRPLTARLQVTIPIPSGEGKTVRPWLRGVCRERAHVAFDAERFVWLVGRAHLARVRDALVGNHDACTVGSRQPVLSARRLRNSPGVGGARGQSPQTHDDG